jgi:hypothetical protein
MKRSEMLKNLANIIGTSDAYTAPVSHYLDEDAMAEEVLADLEAMGMQPPKIKVEVKYPKRMWGAMCSLRCVCEDCDPNFLINEWENEDNE